MLKRIAIGLVGVAVMAGGLAYLSDEGDTIDGAASSDFLLEHVASGYSELTDVDVYPVDGRSLVILQKDGTVSFVDSKTGKGLQIAHIPVCYREDLLEVGLLGLAFHPDFASNGRVFVRRYVCKKPDAPQVPPVPRDFGKIEIVEMRMDLSGPTPTFVRGSEKVVFELDHQPWHVSGHLEFSPLGELFFGVGSLVFTSVDPKDVLLSQDPTTYYGKLLTLDVDGASV